MLRKIGTRVPGPALIEHLRKCSVRVSTENVNKEKIEFPTILDLSYKARKRREREQWYEEVKNILTVEEKIFKLNMPRYYGWYPIIFNENKVHYNTLPLAQYVTRTHLVHKEHLPSSYYDEIISSDALDILVQRIKSQIEDAIIFEHLDRKRKEELTSRDKSIPMMMETLITNALIKQVNRVMVLNLSPEYSHLMEIEVDYDPRVEAFWCIGGIGPNMSSRKSKFGMESLKPYADDPVDRYIQYIGKPVIHIRHCLPLREVVSLDESKNADFDIPDYKYCPSFLGYHRERRHGTIIPGFWPGDPTGFGLLSCHTTGDFIHRFPSHPHEITNALAAQAILASFSWLYAQACYQGFSTYNDVTYPLVNQMVITNGQFWSFYLYQLNTITMHSDCIEENKKSNICWSTKTLKLFDTIEDGKVHGLNEDVLKHLIKFYANAPEERDIIMTPYLGQNTKVIADIEDPERRAWLEMRFKHLMSNRPRHRPMREILHWQKFYMIDNKTRPLEKKREPWEFGINVTRRRLNEHHPAYVPKCLRPDPTKKKRNKWEKTYYP